MRGAQIDREARDALIVNLLELRSEIQRGPRDHGVSDSVPLLDSDDLVANVIHRLFFNPTGRNTTFNPDEPATCRRESAILAIEGAIFELLGDEDWRPQQESQGRLVTSRFFSAACVAGIGVIFFSLIGVGILWLTKSLVGIEDQRALEDWLGSMMLAGGGGLLGLWLIWQTIDTWATLKHNQAQNKRQKKDGLNQFYPFASKEAYKQAATIGRAALFDRLESDCRNVTVAVIRCGACQTRNNAPNVAKRLSGARGPDHLKRVDTSVDK